MDLPRKVPEALNELREAGKCIAFEIPTAAAFHIYGAIELILRRYWTVTTGGRPNPKQRSIGVYLAALKKNDCGDPKVIAALEQLKDLHRNVVVHPDETLLGEDAIALVGMANSVAAAMLKALPYVETNPPAPDDVSFPSAWDVIDEVVD